MNSIRTLCVCLMFLIALNTHAQNNIKESDTLGTKAILVLQDVSQAQLSQIQIIVQDIPEITDALFVSANHQALILDLDLTLGNNLTHYGDISKRLNDAFPHRHIKFKHPNAFNEIIVSTGSDKMTVLK